MARRCPTSCRTSSLPSSGTPTAAACCTWRRIPRRCLARAYAGTCSAPTRRPTRSSTRRPTTASISTSVAARTAATSTSIRRAPFRPSSASPMRRTLVSGSGFSSHASGTTSITPSISTAAGSFARTGRRPTSGWCRCASATLRIGRGGRTWSRPTPVRSFIASTCFATSSRSRSVPAACARFGCGRGTAARISVSRRTSRPTA